MKEHQKAKSVGCKIKTCEQHGDYKAKAWEGFSGRTFYTGCPECESENKAKKERELKEMERKRYLCTLAMAGVSKRFINASFDGYQPESERAAKVLKAVMSYKDQFQKIKETGTSLIMCGRPGTGKTHLANAMVISLLNQGVSALYTTSFRVMARIKATYSKYDATETESGVIKDLTTKDLLIIDEVGVQFGSEAEKVLFYQIINGRYDNVLPTVLISNLTKQELERFIGERCFDRLKEGSGAVLSFDWESYRK
jgi:DNA replication protein DnaC